MVELQTFFVVFAEEHLLPMLNEDHGVVTVLFADYGFENFIVKDDAVLQHFYERRTFMQMRLFYGLLHVLHVFVVRAGKKRTARAYRESKR